MGWSVRDETDFRREWVVDDEHFRGSPFSHRRSALAIVMGKQPG
jgi:hypothetical protein